MPTYTVSIYNSDPVFILSGTIGVTATWTGEATPSGTATITDTETGLEGQTLDSNVAGGESATANVTVGGNTSIGAAVFAEESWTLRDTVTGEIFNVITFRVASGGATGYYTLSETPLVAGRSYETLDYDTDPDVTAGDPAFSIDDYGETGDVVNGTSGDDTIDAGYTDADGDSVGADNDTVIAGAGNDSVDSGGGNDRITGDGGADTLLGGAGNDVILGDTEDGSTYGTLNPTNSDNLSDGGGTETFDIRAVELVTLANGDLIMITAERNSGDAGIASYRIDNDPNSATYGQIVGGQIDTESASVNGDGYENVVDMAAVTLSNGSTYLYTADPQGDSIGITRINSDGTLTDQPELTDGSGNNLFDDVQELTIAEVGGTHFLLSLGGGSDGGINDALVVHEINSDGSLTQRDLEVDGSGTGENYLNNGGPTQASLLESFTDSNGDTFVIAGGLEDGISLWTLNGTGQLTFQNARGDDQAGSGDTDPQGNDLGRDLTSPTATGLSNVDAGAFGEIDGQTYLFVGGTDDDVVMFRIDPDTVNNDGTFDLTLVGQLDNPVNNISSMAFLPTDDGGSLVVGGEVAGLRFYDVTVNTDGTVSLTLSDTISDGTGPEFADSEDIDVEGGILVSASDNDDGVGIVTTGLNPDPQFAGADSIDGGAGNDSLYGGEGGDTILGGDGNDLILGDALPSGAPAESLNWESQGIDGADISAGFTQTTGAMDVTVSFTDDGNNAPTFLVERTDTVFTASGEPFNPNSNLFLFGNGDGATSTTTIDFAANTGTVGDEVQNVSFRLNDIDWGSGNHTDIVTINAFDADGNPVTVSLTPGGGDTVSGNTITAEEIPESVLSPGGSALIEIAGPVSSIEIIYANGQGGTQGVWMTDVHFDTIPADMSGNSDSLLGGAGDDTILGNDGDDTIDGGTGADDLTGGAGDDVFQLSDGFGDDTILGGETGETTGDTIDASGIATGGVAVSVTGEAGSVTQSADSAGFSEIENFVLTDQDDTFEAFGGSDVDVDGGGGNDTIREGAGNNTLSGGDGDDIFEVGFGTGTIDGGTGSDTLSVALADDAVSVIFDGTGSGTYTDLTDGDSGTFTSVEGVQGSSAADIVDATADAGGVNVSGGGGADTITGGSGNDVLDAGADNDTITGGAGDDTLIGGAGNDTLAGGAGADQIDGGAGDDLVDYSTSDAGVTVDLSTSSATGGHATGDTLADVDNVLGSAFDDSLTGYDGTFDDTISNELYGGGGNDTISGLGGDDLLDGGSGNDILIGGTGVDTLFGGLGDDEMYLAEGDTADGGDGDDLFVLGDLGETGSSTITIVGGEGGETNGDTLQLTPDVTPADITFTNTDDTAGGLSGTFSLADGTVVNFSEIENIICFTPGARILTPFGERAIETLKPGDLVITRDSGPQPIRWIGHRTVEGRGKFAPIAVNSTVMDGARRPLLVSPQHRLLFTGYKAQLLFGESEVLVAAKHLVDGRDVRVAEREKVTYFHMMLDRHEVIYAEGAATESFHAGDIGIAAISDQSREEMFRVFPELRSNAGAYGDTARLCLKGHEARLLVDRQAKLLAAA